MDMRRPSPEANVVVAAKDLASYALVSGDDVELTEAVRPDDAVATPDDAVGRVTAKNISKQSPLTDSAFIKLPVSPDEDWLVLFVPSESEQDFEAGDVVALIGVPAEDGPANLLGEAFVLGNEGDEVVLMLAPENAVEAARYLHPDRELLVVRSLGGKVHTPAPTETQTPAFTPAATVEAWPTATVRVLPPSGTGGEAGGG